MLDGKNRNSTLFQSIVPKLPGFNLIILDFVQKKIIAIKISTSS